MAVSINTESKSHGVMSRVMSFQYYSSIYGSLAAMGNINVVLPKGDVPATEPQLGASGAKEQASTPHQPPADAAPVPALTKQQLKNKKRWKRRQQANKNKRARKQSEFRRAEDLYAAGHHLHLSDQSDFKFEDEVPAAVPEPEPSSVGDQATFSHLSSAESAPAPALTKQQQKSRSRRVKQRAVKRARNQATFNNVDEIR